LKAAQKQQARTQQQHAAILRPMPFTWARGSRRLRVNCCGGWWRTALCASRRRSVCGGSVRGMGNSDVIAWRWSFVGRVGNRGLAD
jgi:hypothetical protein